MPEAQIETAAGHLGDGTNKLHYRHLQPEYLTQFIDGVESFWAEVGKLTQVHPRYQRDTKIVDLAPRDELNDEKRCYFNEMDWCRLQDSNL